MNLGLLTNKNDDIRWLKQALAGSYKMCWQADDVSSAFRLQQSQPVELLLMQLNSNGLPADFQQLCSNFAQPIVLFSVDGINHTQAVFFALGAGVKDYVELKCTSAVSTNLLLKKIRQQSVLCNLDKPVVPELPALPMVVAIGASTGGPACLNELIKALPANFNAAVVIVQHMDGRFSGGLVDWLAQSTKLKVKLIEHKEKAVAGVIYIAGSNLHLHLSDEGRFMYSEQPHDSLFKPSIDIFFQSVAKNWRGEAIGILLTGMGQDGAQGMKLMKDKGWLTIAQDQASSVVYGMPKAAVMLQAATEVLSLHKIAARLIALCVN